MIKRHVWYTEHLHIAKIKVENYNQFKRQDNEVKGNQFNTHQ